MNESSHRPKGRTSRNSGFFLSHLFPRNLGFRVYWFGCFFSAPFSFFLCDESVSIMKYKVGGLMEHHGASSVSIMKNKGEGFLEHHGASVED